MIDSYFPIKERKYSLQGDERNRHRFTQIGHRSVSFATRIHSAEHIRSQRQVQEADNRGQRLIKHFNIRRNSFFDVLAAPGLINERENVEIRWIVN